MFAIWIGGTFPSASSGQASPALPSWRNREKGRKKGKTRNISKLVEEDGKKIDDPYSQK
jgi:hypothetical protein